jgi:hypothetical protein
VLQRALNIELGRVNRTPHEALVSSGALYTLLQGTGILEQRARAAPLVARSRSFSLVNTIGCANVFSGPVPNTRVNQDCSRRRQAEEVVVINPTLPSNAIAGQNDSRVGYNHCGYDWSLDGGATWGDQVPPFFQFALGDGHTADACSDPTAAFDSKGNAYVAGILFDVSFPANAIVVEKSNTPINGRFYHSPKADPFQQYLDNPPGVVASDINPNIFNDKELMTADAHAGSPKHDNVYVTWTRFNAATGHGVGSNSPIYFSQSKDGGATWSAGIEISGVNPAICTAGSGEVSPNACDQDQGSHPIVGPDGTVYVAFGNGNRPQNAQHLVVKCLAAKDCTKLANWTPPVKISDDIPLQPTGPNASTGCPAGRRCLPPNGYRLDDFIEGSISIANNGKLFFAWADGRHIAPNCQGSAASATPPCNNDIFYKFSTDGGATWQGNGADPDHATLVTPVGQFGQTAQWQPWSAVQPDGTNLWIGFYDRHYGSCETTGCNDITAAKVGTPASMTPGFTYTRITTASMPNLVPANNPVQAGFLGDYMWVTTNATGTPYFVWADTRGLGGSVEEDIYFAHL